MTEEDERLWNIILDIKNYAQAMENVELIKFINDLLKDYAVSKK